MNIVSNQIIGTLSNVTAEIKERGLTDAANDMWLHALMMYRKHGTTDVEFDSSPLPITLRPQAD